MKKRHGFYSAPFRFLDLLQIVMIILLIFLLRFFVQGVIEIWNGINDELLDLISRGVGRITASILFFVLILRLLMGIFPRIKSEGMGIKIFPLGWTNEVIDLEDISRIDEIDDKGTLYIVVLKNIRKDRFRINWFNRLYSIVIRESNPLFFASTKRNYCNNDIFIYKLLADWSKFGRNRT